MHIKRLFFLISISLLMSSFTLAQSKLDSIRAIWENTEFNDVIRIEALNELIINGYLYNKPDSALILAQTAYKYSEKKDIPYYMGRALSLQGNVCFLKSEYSKALDFYFQAQRIFEEMESKKGISSCLNNIGMVYWNQSKFILALSNFGESQKIYEALNDSLGLSKSLNNSGLIYDELGDYTKALEYYLKSLELSEAIGDLRSMINPVNNIGIIYRRQKERLKALEYYQRSLDLSIGLNDKNGEGKAYNNIGIVYKDLQKYSLALDYYHKSLSIKQKSKDKRGEAMTLLNIANLFNEQLKTDKALDYYAKSLKIRNEIGDLVGQSSTYINIGQAYLSKNSNNQAIKNCKEGYRLALNSKSLLLQRDACKCLYAGYKAQQINGKALENHERMLILNDSIKSDETWKKLQEMEFSKLIMADSIRAEEEKLKIQLAHDAEIQQQNRVKLILIFSGALLLILAIAFILRWIQVKKSRDAISKEKDRSESLLLNILPKEIAQELKDNGKAVARDFDQATILFTDFKEFTQLSEKLSAKELVEEINYCFKHFDEFCGNHEIEKIKTIGDSYMAAGGLPVPSIDSCKKTVLAALDMAEFIINRKEERIVNGDIPYEMRVGIHTGNVVAGIVGVKKFQYDIWGDTVNTASRMESNGEVGQVNISQSTYEILKDDLDFVFESRGKIQAKGKGGLAMYFVRRA